MNILSAFALAAVSFVATAAAHANEWPYAFSRAGYNNAIDKF